MMLELLFLTLLPLVWGVSIFVRVAVGEPPARGAAVRNWQLRAFAASVRQRRVGIISGSAAMVGAPLCFYALARWTGEWDALSAPADKLGVWWAASAAALVALSLATLIVGLWRDPSRGRRRCANCWYDFASADVATPCPECGRVHRSERDLRRTRRSWRAVRGAALLFAASYCALVGQRIVKYGAIGVVPTTFMIPLFEHLPESWVSRYNGRGGELADRVLERQLWWWQYEWLESRVSEVCLRAKHISTISLCCELTRKSFRYPVEAPFHREQLLDDALLHATDADDRTQTAVGFATWFASQDARFDWTGWFEKNVGRITAVVDAQGYGSWGFEWLVLDRAPTDVTWFIVASRFTSAAPRPVGPPRLSRFLGRAGDPRSWIMQQLSGLDGRRRFEFAQAVLAVPLDVDPAEPPVSWPEFFCEIAEDDADPAVRELVRSARSSFANH